MALAINIVWLKNDLRLRDHAPLYYAIQEGLPLLVCYFFEPSTKAATTYSQRQWYFAHQLLQQLQTQLADYKIPLYVFHEEAFTFFQQISQYYSINGIFSYEEIGLPSTKKRNESIHRFCQDTNILWRTFPKEGLQHNLASEAQKNWKKYWLHYVRQHPDTVDLSKAIPLKLSMQSIKPLLLKKSVKIKKPTKIDDILWQYDQIDVATLLEDFLLSNEVKAKDKKDKHLADWAYHTSYAELFPFIVHGSVSVRALYQAIEQQFTNNQQSDKLVFLLNQLLLYSFAKQQFIQFPDLCNHNLNYAFNGIRLKWQADLFKYFQKGQTGFPIIDAAIMALHKQGYINDILLVTLLSFLTHFLWLDWRKCAPYLAQQSLYFDPGSFYCQVQQVACGVGLNSIPIMHPIKTSIKYDPDAAFIKRWLPALKNLPPALCHNPSTMTVLEQQMYACQLGKNYPKPIINLYAALQKAQSDLSRIHQSNISQEEIEKIKAQSITVRKLSKP